MADFAGFSSYPVSIPAYSTSKSVYIRIVSAVGAPMTGLAFDTAGLLASYARSKAARVAITPATLAAITTAWTSGGFKEVDATNMPGVYRLDIPNAALLGGVDQVEVTVWKSATFHGSVTINLSTEDVENPNTTRTDN
jgi:hypothetical protein